MSIKVKDLENYLLNVNADELSALERSLAMDTRIGVKTALSKARKRLERREAELFRVKKLYDYEKSLLLQRGASWAVGLDEVGRGSIAGPLGVCAVVLSFDNIVFGLNDSKQLNPGKRSFVAEQVQQCARMYRLVYISAQEIDAAGMAVCLRKAFSQALDYIEERLGEAPCVLLDGNPLHIHNNELNVVHGDARCASIAAASVLAKVSRDAKMCELSESYPQYNFASNKGYASAEHIRAIEQYGLCAQHRRSFCTSFLQSRLF